MRSRGCKRYSVSLVANLLVLLLAQPASSALIDFDTPAAFSVIDGLYTSSGVAFEGEEDGVVKSLTNSDYQSGIEGVPSAPNYLWNSDHTGPGFPIQTDATRFDIVRILFSTPVTDVSLYANAHSTLGITFNAYDAADDLIETIVINGVGFRNGYVLGSFSSSGITRIEGLQPVDSLIWSMDDLSFTPVPEPSTVLLLLVGVAGLARARVKPGERASRRRTSTVAVRARQ